MKELRHRARDVAQLALTTLVTAAFVAVVMLVALNRLADRPGSARTQHGPALGLPEELLDAGRRLVDTSRRGSALLGLHT